MNGQIIKIVSNLYTVKCGTKLYECHARGKFRNIDIKPVVGDICTIDIENNYILEINERKNELSRPIIANVDVALIIASVSKPNLSPYLIDKLLVNIISNNIEPVICFTKLDIASKEVKKEVKALMKYYNSIGIKALTNTQIWKLKRILKDKVVVLTGQSGAGKSTLLNKLNKKLNLETAPISEALGRGKHTTRHVELFQIGKTYFADTPGFSALDFENLDKDEIKKSFVEFNNYTCPFKDCNHLKERDCEVINAVNNKKILKSRYDNYEMFMKEVK